MSTVSLPTLCVYLCVLQFTVVGYGETVAVSLSSVDDQGNFREAVWSVSAPSQPQVSLALVITSLRSHYFAK